MSVTIEGSTGFEEHESRTKDDRVIREILKIVRRFILHTHRGGGHEVNDRTLMRVVVTAVVLEESVAFMRRYRAIRSDLIGQGSNLANAFLPYAPCLQRTHINRRTDLTGITEHIAVITEGDGTIRHIGIEDSTQCIIRRTGMDEFAMLVELVGERFVRLQIIRQGIRRLIRKVRSETVER